MISVDVMRQELNSMTALESLYILCYLLLIISLNALINVSIVVDKNLDQINSLDDILKRNGRVIPSIYKDSQIQEVFVMFC